MTDDYAHYAPIYDLLFDADADIAFYRRTAAQHLQPGGTVVELGVGTGRLARRLVDSGYRVIGVDSSPAMLAHARRRVRCDLLEADVRSFKLTEPIDLILAPYGLVGHLLTDDDRRRAFRAVHDNLRPGGWFVFDDCPSWIEGPYDSGWWRVDEPVDDPETGLRVRLTTNQMDLAGEPLSVTHDVVDWLDGDRVVKRVILKQTFRNIPLVDEMALLQEAGFRIEEILGSFAGAAFDHERPGRNERVIYGCRRT